MNNLKRDKKLTVLTNCHRSLAGQISLQSSQLECRLCLHPNDRPVVDQEQPEAHINNERFCLNELRHNLLHCHCQYLLRLQLTPH